MVERLTDYFRDRPDLPVHLRDEKFLNHWKVWAGSHNLFSSYVHKRRGRSSQYDAIRAMYLDAGLADEFAAVMSRDFPRYLLKTATRKLRTAIGLPDESPLFRGRA